MFLYTKNGIPLHVSGSIVYSKSGTAFGKIKGNKVFATNGHYIGTIVGDRLVYRQMDSHCFNSPFSTTNKLSYIKAERSMSSIMGEEPRIPT
ncbi:hypothetical protein EFU56_08375 [Vibrio cholerae]|nr:hypothetical protein [Vibrio cholerae]